MCNTSYPTLNQTSLEPDKLEELRTAYPYEDTSDAGQLKLRRRPMNEYLNAFYWVHLGLSWVEIESTAVKVDRCFEVLTVSVAADTSLDRHDLAVEAFSNGIGDPMCAVADDVG